MLSNYLPVLIFVVIAIAIATIAISLGFSSDHVARQRKIVGLRVWFESFEDSRMKLMSAIIWWQFFSLFSIWKSRFYFLGGRARQNRFVRFRGDGGFLGILVIGFIYEWKKEPWNGNRRHS